MKLLSLFSGIGGIDLAAEWAGIQPIAFCEIDPYCQKVLKKHWPDVPIYNDIRSLGGSEIGTVDIVAGGFPCQPFSTAGHKKGRDDERHLWPEMLRVIEEIRPNWVVGENVENAVRMVIDDIIDDLEGINYSTQSFVVPAYCSGAWFSGKRIFIVASSNNRRAALRGDAQFQANAKVNGSGGNNGRGTEKVDAKRRWETESRPYGVVDGLPFVMDRLKCLGNAVVPQQIYPIFAAIAAIERGENPCN